MILTEEPKGTVAFVAKGNGGYDEFVEQICHDDKVYYGALRLTAVDDDSRRTKFLFVVWVGPKVAPLKRARVSTVKSAFELFYKGLHIEVAASAKDDLDKVQLEKKLQAATGAHKPYVETNFIHLHLFTERDTNGKLLFAPPFKLNLYDFCNKNLLKNLFPLSFFF